MLTVFWVSLVAVFVLTPLIATTASQHYASRWILTHTWGSRFLEGILLYEVGFYIVLVGMMILRLVLAPTILVETAGVVRRS